MWETGFQHTWGPAGGHAGPMPSGLHRDGPPVPGSEPSDPSAPRQPDAYGQFYPASWPAGPWVVVVFWTAVFAVTALLHWLG
jgi:hypothetical protein